MSSDQHQVPASASTSSDNHMLLDVALHHLDDDDGRSETGKSSSSGGQPFGSPNPSEADDPNDPDKSRRHYGRKQPAKPDLPSTPRSSFPMSERQQLAFLKKIMTPEHSGASSERASISPRSPSSTPGLAAASGTTPNTTPSTSGKRWGFNKPSTVDRRNDRGETRLHVAARRGETHRCKQLIGQGATVDAVDNAGWTPLHEACNHSCYKAAKVLLQHGANVNATGMGDDTPLHDAAANNNFKVINLLLRFGASTTVRNKKGQQPIDLCTDKACLDLLTNKSAQDSQPESDALSADEDQTSQMANSPAHTSDHEEFVHCTTPLLERLSARALDHSSPPTTLPPAVAAAVQQEQIQLRRQQEEKEREQELRRRHEELAKQKEDVPTTVTASTPATSISAVNQPRRRTVSNTDAKPSPSLPVTTCSSGGKGRLESQSTMSDVEGVQEINDEADDDDEEDDEDDEDDDVEMMNDDYQEQESNLSKDTPVNSTDAGTPLRRSNRGVKMRVIRSPPGTSPGHTARRHMRSPNKTSQSQGNAGTTQSQQQAPYSLVRRRREYQRCKRQHQQQHQQQQQQQQQQSSPRLAAGTGRRRGRPSTRNSGSLPISPPTEKLTSLKPDTTPESQTSQNQADDMMDGGGVFDFHDSDSEEGDITNKKQTAKQPSKPSPAAAPTPSTSATDVDSKKSDVPSSSSSTSVAEKSSEKTVPSRKRRLLGDAATADSTSSLATQPSAAKLPAVDQGDDKPTAADDKHRLVPPLKLSIGAGKAESTASKPESEKTILEAFGATSNTGVPPAEDRILRKERHESGSSKQSASNNSETRLTRAIVRSKGVNIEQLPDVHPVAPSSSTSSSTVHPKKRSTMAAGSRSSNNISGKGSKNANQPSAPAPPPHWSQTLDTLPNTDNLLAGNSYQSRISLNKLVEHRWFEHDQRYAQLRSVNPNPIDTSEFMTKKKSYLLYDRWKREKEAEEKNVTTPKDVSVVDAAVYEMLYSRQQEQRQRLQTEQRVQRERLQVSFEHQLLRVSNRHGHAALRPLSCTRLLRDADLSNCLELDAPSLLSPNSVPLSVAATAQEALMSIDKLMDKVVSKYNKQKLDLERRHELEAQCLLGSQQLQWQSAYRKASHLTVHDPCPTPGQQLVPSVVVPKLPDIQSPAQVGVRT